MYKIGTKTHYPTPPALIERMLNKLKTDETVKSVNGSFRHTAYNLGRTILEPSAGDGAILEYFHKLNKENGYNFELFFIEKEPELVSVIHGKDGDYNLIGYDFLEYQGGLHFDTIIMNPPFDNGHKHLLKAIDIMFNGNIICLLNAQTIKNPYSRSRQNLVNKLNELNAEIEFIENAFLDSERKTNVEIALITIKIENSYKDLFNEKMDISDTHNADYAKNKDITLAENSIEQSVIRYNQTIDKVKNTIINAAVNADYISNFIGFTISNSYTDKKYAISKDDEYINLILNTATKNIRMEFWKNLLNRKEIQSKLTNKGRDDFIETINNHVYMEYTLKNIQWVIAQIGCELQNNIKSAIIKFFDDIAKASYNGDGNLHYYSTWKTNKAYKIGKKAILSTREYLENNNNKYIRNSFWLHRSPFNDYEQIFKYFDGDLSADVTSGKIINDIYDTGDNNFFGKWISLKYFNVKFFKKMTVHFQFTNETLLRDLNLFIAQERGWLGYDYGKKPYSEMCDNEKVDVAAFDGDERDKTGEINYINNLNRVPLNKIIGKSNYLQITNG